MNEYGVSIVFYIQKYFIPNLTHIQEWIISLITQNHNLKTRPQNESTIYTLLYGIKQACNYERREFKEQNLRKVQLRKFVAFFKTNRCKYKH